jgi:hypothetical protein
VFSQLDIVADGANTVVTVFDANDDLMGTITLVGVGVGAVTETDFIL